MPRSTKRRTARRKRRRKSKSTLQRYFPFLLWGGLIVLLALVGYNFYHHFLEPKSQLTERVDTLHYPDGEVRGIDISHYQNEIDWRTLRDAIIKDVPIRFVFIKATEGADKFDPYFNLYFAQARRNELTRGAYHFFSTKSTGRKQAEYFCRMVQLEPGDLPPVLDVEIEVDKLAGYSREKLRKEVKDWLNVAEAYYGVPPILYASSAYKQHYLNGADFERYPFWIAHYYVKNPTYEGSWAFWQHTDRGHVEGIKGKVDIDVFNGSAADFAELLLKE